MSSTQDLLNTLAGAISGTTMQAQVVPGTSGGLSVYRSLDASPTGVIVKSSAGQVYGWEIYNNAAAARFVKLYNLSGTPTASGTPALTLGMAQTSVVTFSTPDGIAFDTGIGLRATTGVADNDTGTPTGNDVVVNLVYK